MKKTCFCFCLSTALLMLNQAVAALSLNDSGKISATSLTRVIQIKSEADIVNAIAKAKQQQLPIAIMGKQHSQGGQTLAANAIALNMLPFNKVLAIDVTRKQVTVQAGIIWSDLQKYINSYNLAVMSMQSPNIFTVGGSISVNAHGDDFRAGSLINSVVAFEMILANGKKILVTKKTNPILWQSVIGGYGLFGVIANVRLQLTDNNLLVSHYEKTTMDNFPNYFRQRILNKKDTVLFYAHLNIVPDSNFLKDLYVITYTDTHQLPKKIIPLDNPDKWKAVLTPVFNISRYSEFGKSWRWHTEQKVFRRIYNNKVVSRNNAMEKPVSFAANYQNAINADWLQEYFIPLNNLPAFINQLRPLMLNNNVNLLNITIRYVPAEPDLLLSYAKQNSFAVVLYFNQSLTKEDIQKTKIWTQDLIAIAQSLNGSYYLPYQNFATLDQFHKIYPGYKKLIEYKNTYDPKHIFVNQFYQTYF